MGVSTVVSLDLLKRTGQRNGIDWDGIIDSSSCEPLELVTMETKVLQR